MIKNAIMNRITVGQTLFNTGFGASDFNNLASIEAVAKELKYSN